MDSLVTLLTTASTSTSSRGNSFCAMGWQFYTDILQGVDIPAGKKLYEKGDFRKIVEGDFFVPLSRETAKYVFVFLKEGYKISIQQ